MLPKTKQIPHVRTPVTRNSDVTYVNIDYRTPPFTQVKLLHRDISVGGNTLSVPMYITRHNTMWRVNLPRHDVPCFYFHDDRYLKSPDESLARAIDFIRSHYHTKVALLPVQPFKESKIKNVEFGASGISVCWRRGKFASNPSLQLVLHMPGDRQRTRTISKKALDQPQLEREVGKLMYVRYIFKVTPGMSVDMLDGVAARIKAEKHTTPSPYPVTALTMQQLDDNLEVRQKVWSGKGAIDPYTDRYVR